MSDKVKSGIDIALEKRIIFALDVASVDEAKALVRRLENHVRFFKVGLQLFLAGWFKIVDWIVDREMEVMLDLKFYDIPQTVASAVAQLNGRGVSLTTVHGNGEIIKAATQSSRDVKILAVTVLTSMSESDLREMGCELSVEELVLSRARNALEHGCNGVVASGLEVPALREALGNDFLIITPGVRPLKSIKDDQKRVIGAREAFENGSDHVVIGRPIRDAKDPAALIAEMKQDILSGINLRRF